MNLIEVKYLLEVAKSCMGEESVKVKLGEL